MKTLIKRTLMSLPVLLLGLALYSFTAPFGGDTVEVYQGNQLLLRQHIHIDKELKTIRVDASGEKVYVYYSHCGTNGQSRSLTLRDAGGQVVKTWNYADAQGTAKSLMECRIQEAMSVSNLKKAKLFLYYNSKEMGGERKIAGIELK